MITTKAQIAQQLQQWYQAPAGQKILQQADATLATSVSEMIGYYALALSYFDCGHRWYDKSKMRTQLLSTATNTDASQTVCDFAKLPFDTESIDSILTHHILEFADDPYAIIREIHRVLMPGGKTIIIGFNPFGIYGLIKHFKPGLSIPWGGTFFSMMRIKEWLSVLGFAVDKACYIAPLGFHHTNDSKRFKWVAPLLGNCAPITGGVFILIVSKQVTQPIQTKKIFQPVSLLKSRGRVAQPIGFRSQQSNIDTADPAD